MRVQAPRAESIRMHPVVPARMDVCVSDESGKGTGSDSSWQMGVGAYHLLLLALRALRSCVSAFVRLRGYTHCVVSNLARKAVAMHGFPSIGMETCLAASAEERA